MGIFPHDEKNGVGGSITHRPELIAGPGGTLIYLNVEGDLEGVLSRVARAGGSVVKDRSSIGEHGFIGIIKDVEGNIVGLHSLK
jgi:predicted enzyme related to lactoylglutathione lyase